MASGHRVGSQSFDFGGARKELDLTLFALAQAGQAVMNMGEGLKTEQDDLRTRPLFSFKQLRPFQRFFGSRF